MLRDVILGTEDRLNTAFALEDGDRMTVSGNACSISASFGHSA